jgi:F-type H+-transporting ATPase subunit epsilon
MRLKILLPFRVFADIDAVLRLVAQTTDGSVGMLPHRLDCAATLVPGILEYETEADGTAYFALDEGVMVKSGPDVLVSVRRAIAGGDLGQLHQQVEEEFLTLSAEEESARAVMAKLEVSLLRRFAKLRHE